MSYQVVLTKADKVKPAELDAVETATAKQSADDRRRIRVLATSSEKGDGLDALRQEIAAFSTAR